MVALLVFLAFVSSVSFLFAYLLWVVYTFFMED